MSLCGGQLKFVSELKYLGVYLVAAKCFTISVNQLKVNFFRVFNCIYARSKAANSEMVTVELLKAYCQPFLVVAYGIGQTIIFLPCGYFFLSFTSPNLRISQIQV